MSNEILFLNLLEIAENKKIISDDFEKAKWKSTEYIAGKYHGKMLHTAESELPDPVILNPNLSGVYRIYICIPKLRSGNYLYIKLDDDLCYTGVRPTDFRPESWGEEEFFEEIYWKTARLDGKKIIIDKPDTWFNSVTSLAWIRCVPAPEEELNEKIPNKCMHVHSDQDLFLEDSFRCDDDYFIRLYQMKNSNVETLSLEFSFEIDKLEDVEVSMKKTDKRWGRDIYGFTDKKDEFNKKAVEFCHKNEMEIYAANRMSVASFVMPSEVRCMCIRFPEEHPQFYCQNRNGSFVKICSYAYPEVQEYAINNFLGMLKYGYDGITLICHRGAHVAFEKPVIERFKSLYPDIDPTRLPLSDERLHNVLCSFMNEFMHKLRKAIDDNSDRHIKINVITEYGLQSSKNFGVDVEYWAKNGLIDSVCQGDMEMYEDLDGCMNDENPEYIDMDKYNDTLCERPVIKRNFATDVDKVCKYIPEYMNLKRKYNIEVYNVIPWVHTITPEEYDDVIEKMKEAGAEKFLSFNTNHMVWDLPEWYNVSRIGNKRNDSFQRRRFVRLISLNGNDVSQLNPNWRG